MNDDTEVRIKALKDYLKGFDFNEDKELTKELNELKILISKVQEEIETVLQYVIAKRIGKLLNSEQEKNIAYRALADSLISPFLVEVDFFRFIKVLKSKKFILSEEYNKFVYLNDLRRWFAHPLVYKPEIEQFKDRKKYLSVLRSLSELYNITSQVLDRISPKTN